MQFVGVFFKLFNRKQIFKQQTYSSSFRFSSIHQQQQKAIDTLNQKELRQLLSYRSTDKSSLSSLRSRSYELLRSNYLSTKSKLQSILEKQKYVFVRAKEEAEKQPNRKLN